MEVSSSSPSNETSPPSVRHRKNDEDDGDDGRGEWAAILPERSVAKCDKQNAVTVAFAIKFCSVRFFSILSFIATLYLVFGE